MKAQLAFRGVSLFLLFAFSTNAAEVRPAVKAQAQDFPLSAVKLLDGSFRQAMDVDRAFLLRIEPDRLLAGFRTQAGLPKKAEPYRGWEAINPTNRYTMAGHSLGHYLSAMAMLASTGDAECRHRAEYIVAELAECQKAGGTGMLCASPDSRAMFAEISAGEIKSDHLFGLNGGYVPFYNIHKVMAGLRDAWLLLGNQTARDVLVRETDWLGSVFEKLSDQQVQDVLETEHGGIMEVVADVYAITGDAKYLALARRLNHKKMFEPLSRGEDPLTAVPPARPVHANAQIPKVIGMERLYELTGEKDFATAAHSFWDKVVNTRSFVIGGHGENEFFFAPADFPTRGINSTTGPETCNTYNMLKLSRKLWLVQPSAPTADFIERALFNHILSSQDPDEGGFVYFTSMRPGHYRTYCDATNSFWCCTGTGMENHAKYGEFIYAHSGDHLWVDQLIASELDWTDQGAKVRLDTRFPEGGKATLTFTTQQPRKLIVSIRCASWLKAGAMKLAVNGKIENAQAQPGSYATIERTWKTGDKIELEWPLSLRTEMLPRSTNWVAVLWGPIVLAGELGTNGLERVRFHGPAYSANRSQAVDTVPHLVGTTNDVLAKIKPVAGKQLEFRTDGLAAPAEVTLAPFYMVHKQRYAVYWRLEDKPAATQQGN
jgi:DUF1680 family protein